MTEHKLNVPKLKHTAPPGTYLAHVCDAVAFMKPGECLCVSAFELKFEVPSFFHNGAEFRPADRVLGNIIGSAYTHSYTEDRTNDTITFCRHEETGQRYYTAPDWRTK